MALSACLVFCLVSCGKEKSDRLVLGDERFEEYVPGLEGKRVAVFSNQTGIVGNVVTDNGFGPHLVDALIERGVDVKAIFSPEHGFRGEADAGERVESGVDEKTGVEILSLYGRNRSLGDEETDDLARFPEPVKGWHQDVTPKHK